MKNSTKMNLYLLHNQPSQLLAYDKVFRFMDKYGSVIFRNERGYVHRDNGSPAVIWPNGVQQWWVNGNLHRDNDLPAAIRSNGSRFWYVNGQLHRDNDLPAVIWSNGTQEWWVNGVRVK